MVLDSSGSCDTGWLRQRRSGDCWQDCSDDRGSLGHAQVQDAANPEQPCTALLAMHDVQGTLSA